MLIASDATGSGDQFCRTFDAMEVMGGIVRVVEPTEPPVTTRLQILRQFIALTFITDTSISCAPTVVRSAILRGTAIKDTDTTARNLKVEVVVP